MKLYSKIISTLVLTATLSFANCGGGKGSGGSDLNGLVVSNFVNGLVRSAVTGNCAISLNLGTLYAGAIVSGAVNSTTNFTEASYVSASGSTLTAQGYQSYAVVPYNKKYDAFMNTTGVWTAALRNTALASSKVSTDLGALTGAVAAFCAANLATNLALAAPGAVTSGTLQAVANGAFATFSATEQAGINAAINASFNTATGGLVTTWESYVTSAIPNVGLANGSGASCASFANMIPTAASLNSVVNGVATNAGGITNIISAYAARTSWRSGIAILACSRIPRSNCSLPALATATRAADITSVSTTYNTIQGTPECAKPSQGTLQSILNQITVGLPREITVTNLNARNSFLNVADVGGSEGSTTSAATNKILADRQYPKIAALQNLSSSFVTAFPMNTGTTPYGVTTGSPSSITGQATTASTAATGPTSDIPWYGGSNINFTTVESCESIGLTGIGPTPLRPTEQAATTTLTAVQNGTLALSRRRLLTPVNEIVYSFSSNGTAASEYSLNRGVTYTSSTTDGLITVNAGSFQGMNDSVACNTSLRSKTAIPAQLGVGTKLPVLNTPRGDGDTTSLLTACVYGGTAGATGTRAVVAGIFATTLFNISECPAAAQPAASTFGEYGLSGFGAAGFPNGRD